MNRIDPSFDAFGAIVSATLSAGRAAGDLLVGIDGAIYIGQAIALRLEREHEESGCTLLRRANVTTYDDGTVQVGEPIPHRFAFDDGNEAFIAGVAVRMSLDLDPSAIIVRTVPGCGASARNAAAILDKGGA